MKRKPFPEHSVADIISSERVPGRDDLRDMVQWQMPDAVMRRFQAGARRQGTDINTFIHERVCAALTERAEAIRRMVHQVDRHGGTLDVPPCYASSPGVRASCLRQSRFDLRQGVSN